MNFSNDKMSYKRVLGSMLPQHTGESVCLLGSLIQLEPSGRMLKLKTSDDQVVNVQLPQPAIKLCYDDPDLFQTSVTSTRCDFVLGHFEAFMQMYKTQGSTFWLRFLVSFKNHVEEKFCSNKKWLAFLMSHYQFIKVLNFIYISLHKKFLEGSNTAVKKFIHNLISLALNSPSYLNYSCQQWLIYIKSCKQLYNIFQNLFKVSEPVELSGFTAFIFTVYTDFFCALCAVFEQWYKASDLSEEELKKLDSKVIYWLPAYDTERKIQPSCFEKYISDYWKENLQRMLLTDNIHELFNAHKSVGCCEKFDKEKNIFKVFQFTDKHTIELMKILNNEGDIDDSEDSVHTITEVCMKDICVLKPQAALCTAHKKCFVKICHVETCLEPFVCKGDEPCISTCETKLKSARKQEKKSGKKQEKFWKTITAEIFPIDKKKSEVSTLVESYNRDIQTYLQVRESYELDMPLSVLRHTYHQCLAELHNFDLNPRRTECLNRLRKKLSKKNPSNSFQLNVSSLRQPFYRESLLENAMDKMLKFREQYCVSKGHDVKKCETKCFTRAANTVAVSTSNAFGRVILLSKTYITIPYELTCNGKINSCISDKPANSNNSKKNVSKQPETPQNNKKNTNSLIDNPALNSSDKESIKVDTVSDESNKEIKIADEDQSKDVTDDDDDIDEILKLIGIGEPDKNLTETAEEINDVKFSGDALKASSKDDEAVENFFKLIGVNEATLDQDRTYISQEESNNTSLKICAYCKKKETQRKMFKKCSRCKEENFPVQHYYCSRECLLEDWAETHEDEHLRFNKQTF